MAITINGAGTITGITAGGLSDGSITNDDLAGNITNDKLAGNIADDKLSGVTCKAWVNFNGTGTVAIRASYNVSSITDDGTGQYTINLTSALPDTNYCAQVSTNFSGSTSGWIEIGQTRTTSTCSIYCSTHANFTGDGRTPYDYSSVNATIFR